MKTMIKTTMFALSTLILAASITKPVQAEVLMGGYICQNSQAYYVYLENGEWKKVPVSRSCQGTGFLDW
ncbi:hypothetical protein ABMY35_11920 [Pseudoalteromonas sp. BZB3]|uniref:hypothetical protein n=1 Tax=Pseudoalteromonas sp. BZB3 TaxID=3136670 RepID=UPI0032C47038